MHPKIGSLVFVGLLSSPSLAEPSFFQKIEALQSQVEVLNSLGRRCEAHLRVQGMKGASSEECSSYLRNMQGDYFESFGRACQGLLDTYEAKRKAATKTPNFAKNHPAEAKQLVDEIKAVNGVCDPTNLQKNYPFITKPLATIKALSSVK